MDNKTQDQSQTQDPAPQTQAPVQAPKVLTLDEELAIMKKDQERNLKKHAEQAKLQQAPKIPARPIELESEKFKK